VSPFDNALAVGQIEAAYTTLLERPIASPHGSFSSAHLAKDGKEHPRIVSLGGDHTIVCNHTAFRQIFPLTDAQVLPILRSLHKVYGPVSVVHFDAHLDTWPAVGYPGSNSAQGEVTHGTFFWVAAREGLMSNNSIHAGIRCKFNVR
jgi:guanidinobutyrase / D-arginase